MTTPTHLIIICCHAIYVSGPSRGVHEGEWLLSPFQAGESSVFTQHIQAGLRLLAEDRGALLLFSGSRTRTETQRSEARSYLDLAEDNDCWGLLDGEGRGRMGVEEQALDSFGNLVFATVGFWRRTGMWPENITIVGHGFKRDRFLGLHVSAMRWPRERVRFVGIDPEYMREGSEEWDGERADEVRKGERERGLMVWEGDLFGVGEMLRRKRRERNHWGVGQLLFESEEDRARSGIRSEVVDCGDGLEERLKNEMQPWESDCRCR